MGIVNLMDDEKMLKELTAHRTLGALPIAGRYRMIDFILSNMVNSGIKNIGLLTQNKYGSIMDHVKNGREWDLDRKRDGLFLLPPDYSHYPYNVYKWDLRHYYSHLEYLEHSKQDYVLIASSDAIFNTNFKPMFDFHTQKDADITIMYKEIDPDDMADLQHCVAIETGEDGRIKDIEINVRKVNKRKLSMDICFMKKQRLLDLIEACSSHGYCDMLKDGFIRNLPELKIYGYEHKGYYAKITNIKNYYKYSMDLITEEVLNKVFFEPGLIHTKVKDAAPTKYTESASVHNCLIANDCIIEGTVENSILFRGVKIGKNAVIKDSIIMQMCKIEENATIENVILDKDVLVTGYKNIRSEKSYPMVLSKKSVI
jgi:glucose-1-phosphate adenylyltransferase